MLQRSLAHPPAWSIEPRVPGCRDMHLRQEHCIIPGTAQTTFIHHQKNSLMHLGMCCYASTHPSAGPLHPP